MALRKYYIGSLGPFLYDDTDSINDPDGDFAGENFHGLITDGPVKVDNTPSTTFDVLRFDDIGSLIASPEKSIEVFSSTGTITFNNNLIYASGTYDLFLPTVADGEKRVYNIKNIGSGIITLKANAGEATVTIEKELTQPLRPDYNITVVSDAIEWWVL